MKIHSQTDTLVLGGGVVGMSIAYGLARAGSSVRVLDGEDVAYRASRGNFGLVWVQGKGAGRPNYARWTMHSARHWAALAQDLADTTGVDVELSQPGGVAMCLSEAELADRADKLATLSQLLETPYPYEVLDARQVREMIPETGPDVVGAIYCPMDGHVSPLRLLRALVQGLIARGGELVTGARVERITHQGGEFRVETNEGIHTAGRIVLAAGLGNATLAPQVGLQAPVFPLRGQILVTERLAPFLRHPTHYVRQTGEGVVQIGDSKEEVGFDDGTTTTELARIALRAQRCFPLLAGVNVVRTWGALRVMTPDGFPIYQESRECPGAFVVTCHSGITLAAAHAGRLVEWIRGDMPLPEIKEFAAERFHV